MMKNCDAKCDAHQNLRPIHLWLRKNIFYCRMELPRMDGKRRYKRISLHTNNYYEARTLMNEQQELINNINDLRKLFSQLRLDDSDFPYKPSPSSQSTGVYCFRGIQIVQKVSSSNNKSLLERVWTLFKKLEGKEKQLPQDVNEILVTIRASEQVFKQGIFVKVGSDASKGMVPQQTSQPILQSLIQSTKQIQPTVIENQPSLTIQQVFDDMLQRSGNVESSKSRKKNMIIAMLKGVGLSLKNDYAKFHDRNVINKIIQNVMNIENLKNGGKKTCLGYIKELVLHACAMEPDFFSQKVIAGMPTIKKMILLIMVTYRILMINC